jgi:hypothetical protein
MIENNAVPIVRNHTDVPIVHNANIRPAMPTRRPPQRPGVHDIHDQEELIELLQSPLPISLHPLLAYHTLGDMLEADEETIDFDFEGNDPFYIAEDALYDEMDSDPDFERFVNSLFDMDINDATNNLKTMAQENNMNLKEIMTNALAEQDTSIAQVKRRINATKEEAKGLPDYVRYLTPEVVLEYVNKPGEYQNHGFDTRKFYKDVVTSIAAGAAGAA